MRKPAATDGSAKRESRDDATVGVAAILVGVFVALAVPIASTTSAHVLALNCSGHRRDLTARIVESSIAPQVQELACATAGALSCRAPPSIRAARVSADAPSAQPARRALA